MSGEQFPGKLVASCALLAADASSYIADGATIVRIGLGHYRVTLREGLDPNDAVPVVSASGGVATWVRSSATVYDVFTAAYGSGDLGVSWGANVLPASGANYAAQYAAGAPINDHIGPFALVHPMPLRTVQCVIGKGGANPVRVTVTGTDFAGNALVEIIVCAGAGTYQGTKAFKTITIVQTDVDPGGTLDVQTGDGFGLGQALLAAGTPRIGVDGLEGAVSSSDGATGTVVPATSPNGAHAYYVEASSAAAAGNSLSDLLFSFLVFRTQFPGT